MKIKNFKIGAKDITAAVLSSFITLIMVNLIVFVGISNLIIYLKIVFSIGIVLSWISSFIGVIAIFASSDSDSYEDID